MLLKRLVGKKDVKDAFSRLDMLTKEAGLMLAMTLVSGEVVQNRRLQDVKLGKFEATKLLISVLV